MVLNDSFGMRPSLCKGTRGLSHESTMLGWTSILGGPFGPEKKKFSPPLPLIPCKHPPGPSAPHPPTRDPPPPFWDFQQKSPSPFSAPRGQKIKNVRNVHRVFLLHEKQAFGGLQEGREDPAVCDSLNLPIVLLSLSVCVCLVAWFTLACSSTLPAMLHMRRWQQLLPP